MGKEKQKKEKRQSLKPLVIQFEAKVSFSADVKTKPQKLKVGFFPQHNFVAIFKLSILNSLNTIQLPDFIYHINEIENILLITENKKVELTVKKNQKITITCSKASQELNNWFENIDRNLKLLNGFYQMNENIDKLNLKYQTASIYEYKYGKNIDITSAYQEYFKLRPFQFFQEVIQTQNNELNDHYWFGSLRKSVKNLKQSVTSQKNKQKKESNQKYFGFLLTSKPKVNYGEIAIDRYPYYFTNVIDNGDLPDWINLNFLYLFKIKNKKKYYHILKQQILSILKSQVQQIQLVESLKDFEVEINYIDRQLVFNFDCASFALQFYDWMKFAQNCFEQSINSLGGIIKRNVDVFLDESKKMYFDDITRKILINKQQKSFREKNFLGTIDLQTITALQKEILLPFFCQKEQDIKSFKLNIKKVNDLYLESLKEKISDIEDNELAHLYDHLVHLNKHIKLMNFYQLEDRRFEIAFNCLLNNFKKLFFNRAAELMAQILDRLMDEKYLLDPNTNQKTYKIYIDFFKELNQFLQEFEQFKNFKVYNILKAEFIRKIFFYFFNHFRYIFKNNPSFFKLEDFIALLSGISYGNDQVLSLSENLFLKKFLQNYKMLFYNIASELMIETKKLIDKTLKEKLKNLDVQIFSIKDILNFQLKDINEMLDAQNNIYHQNIQRYLIIKILEGFVLEVEKQNQEWIQKNLKDKIKSFREYFNDMGEKQFCQFDKFLLYYYKFIMTKSEEHAKMYLGMMPTILGEFLPENIIKSMIDTKESDFFGIQKLKYKMYYDQLLSEQKKGDQKIKDQRKYKKQIRRNLYLLYVAGIFIKFAKDAKKRIYFRQKQQQKKVNKKIAQRNFDVGKIDINIEVLFLHNDEFAINSSEQNFVIIKKKLINAQFIKFKLFYQDGLINFYNKEHKIVKTLFAAKIKSIQKNAHEGKHILVLSYQMNFKIVLQSQKAEKVENLKNDIEKITQKLNKILINDKKITIVKEQEVFQNVQFFLNMFCAQGYVLVQPKIIPSLDLKFYPNYKTFEFLLPEQLKAWSEKHPQNFISQRTFLSKPNTLRNKRKQSVKNLFEDSNLKASSMSQNDDTTLGLQRTKNQFTLGHNSQIRGLLSKNELTSKNQNTSNLRKVSMSEPNVIDKNHEQDIVQYLKQTTSNIDQLLYCIYILNLLFIINKQIKKCRMIFNYKIQKLITTKSQVKDIQQKFSELNIKVQVNTMQLKQFFKKINMDQAHPEEKIALQREIKIQKALDHRNIVKLFNSEEKDEYIRGGALFDYLMKHENGFKESQALDYFKQMTKAIEYLHKNKILHRDLKPENILIDRKGLIKLCDFGFTAFFGDQVRITKCGTREYMAPEIFQNQEQDLGVDVWSLGILLFELTHKATPFPLSVLMQFRQVHKNYKIPFKKDLSQEIKNLVMKILKNDPKKRLTASEILNEPLMKQVKEEGFHLEKMSKKNKKNNSKKPDKKKKNQNSVNKSQKIKQENLKQQEIPRPIEKIQNDKIEEKNIKKSETNNSQSKKNLSPQIIQKKQSDQKFAQSQNTHSQVQNSKTQKLRYLLENNKQKQDLQNLDNQATKISINGDKIYQSFEKNNIKTLNIKKIEKPQLQISQQQNTQKYSQQSNSQLSQSQNFYQSQKQSENSKYIQKLNEQSDIQIKRINEQYTQQQLQSRIQQNQNSNINTQNQLKDQSNADHIKKTESQSKLNLEPRRQVAYAKSSNRNINIYSNQQQSQKDHIDKQNIKTDTRIQVDKLKVLSSLQNISITQNSIQKKSRTPVRRSSSRKVKISLSLQKSSQNNISKSSKIKNGQKQNLTFKEQVKKFNNAKKNYYKIKDYNFSDQKQENNTKKSPFMQLYQDGNQNSYGEKKFATGQKNIYNKLNQNNALSDHVNRSLHNESLTERKVPLFPVVYDSLRDSTNNRIITSHPNLNQTETTRKIKYTLEAEPNIQRTKYQSSEKYSYKVNVSQKTSSIKKRIRNEIEETYHIGNTTQKRVEIKQPRVYSTEQVRTKIISSQNIQNMPSLQHNTSNQQQVARAVKKFTLENHYKVQS